MIRVVCAFIEQESKVLIAQRGPGQSAPGMWEFPGGKVEPGETEQDALARELKEELNMEVEIQARIGEYAWSERGRSFTLIGYVCTWKGGVLELREHQDTRWVSPMDLLKAELTLPDIPLAHRYLEICGIEAESGR